MVCLEINLVNESRRVDAEYRVLLVLCVCRLGVCVSLVFKPGSSSSFVSEANGCSEVL